METIVFHSYRGGVGKTLLSVNTAVKLAILGKKVCLVDFDLRAPSHQAYFYSSSFISIESGKKSFTDFLVGKTEANQVITPTSIVTLFCVFSDIEILQKKGSKTRTKLTQHGEGKILAKLFEFIRYCNSNDFDYVIIDNMPGLTYRSLDALVVSDKIMVVTRPAKSEISGLSLVISECYSKLEGSNLYAILNQIENQEDLALSPNQIDIQLAEENIADILNCFKESSLSIPLIHRFRRIPFVTERLYVLEEENHPFSNEIGEFCNSLLKS